MKRFTTPDDRPKLNELIRKELYHYPEVKHDCESVQAVLWQLINCITDKRDISIEYYRSDRKWVTHRLRPASVMFNDFYFYLIAFSTEDDFDKPLYFRVDRIKYITEHRKKFTDLDAPDFDEGLLRQRSLFMWPGKLRTIRFEFTGTAIQAIDRSRPQWAKTALYSWETHPYKGGSIFRYVNTVARCFRQALYGQPKTLSEYLYLGWCFWWKPRIQQPSFLLKCLRHEAHERTVLIHGLASN